MLQQLAIHTVSEFGRGIHHAAAKTDANDGVFLTPVPAGVGSQAGKQRPVAFEEFLEGIEKQTFAKTPGAREKVLRAPGDQIDSDAGFVHVVAVVFADFGESLNANGQALAWQGGRRGVHART